MPKRSGPADDEEVSKKAKPSSKKERQIKKRAGGKHDDENSSDSDVDHRGNIRGLIAYSDETDSEEEERPVKKRKAALKADKLIKKELAKAGSKYRTRPEPEPVRPAKKAKRQVVESSSEEESEDDDFDEFGSDDDDEEEGETLGSEDTDEEEEEESDDDEEASNISPSRSGTNLLITIGGGEDDIMDPMVPQRHNMKKEGPAVKKFVKLLTTPVEDNTIDAHIDQFKALPVEKQEELIKALERRPTTTDTGVNLMLRILTLKIPTETQALVLAKYNSLQTLDPATGEYFKVRNWLDKMVSIPFGLYKEMPVKIDDGSEACASFMKTAQKSLDDAIYGQQETKLQILQYITTKITNPHGRGTSLLLVGPPGIGKTSLIKNGIAKALGWPFQFISLGGDSDASTYTGHQLVYESSHCGKIVNSLIGAKSMSTVLLFDEVDKVSATPKGEEVQNMLIHLTDPTSNEGFEDKYLSGVPIDLSKVMFIFSANDINKIDKVLLDRLMVIELKGYDIKQKVAIAEQYLLPAALKDVSLVERVAINKDLLTYVIEEYAKEEMGVRELKRCIEQITQKINMLRMYNSKDLPFYIKDFSLPFTLKKEHVDLFLKKKEDRHAAPMGMYM
jgi:ATP-dependent Clp protease ATP-binding subunit ClpA